MNRGGHRSWSGIGPVEAAAGDFIYLGRRLYPLLREAGFDRVSVSPRVIYVDGGRPDLMDGFILKTFTAMIAGIRESAVAEGLASAQQFNAGAAAHRGGGRQLLLHVFKRRGLKGE